MSESLSKATEMFRTYLDAIESTRDLLSPAFSEAVELIAGLDSILIVTGLGKSGLVGQKAAATFRSTGTQAAFVHPVEALHGDLGIVRTGSATLAISKSGGNEETIEFVRQFRNINEHGVITLSEPGSRMEKLADIALHIPKLPEIDEWNLAPTTSSLSTLAMCDVLAICVQQRKNLTASNFAQFHPSGTLGRRLLLNVRDLMIRGASLPTIPWNADFSDVIYEISSKGLGLVLLLQEDGSLFGTLTDGDIRRLLERGIDVSTVTAESCYRLSRRENDLPPVAKGWTTPDSKAIECLRQMQESQITSLVITEDDRPVGLIRMQDLVKAGL